ncbi:glycosyl transferase GT2 family [Butyrivibrio proteoclasticus B316]|uniref:Glycosyl transferase GT2 family n=1 Tax=Butyrivibrio proteoclasticus (strain ATCC 51982 / DSM 14932 / B316) TaxID=515622 RepID=E0RX04_BUTPB|nr:glycosyltransferase family A protein [Butyrivibrio proteoclasticus]ADL34912.1 glycosyl transferase GT2 family [Butyrivibrio proteoclasticus B316]
MVSIIVPMYNSEKFIDRCLKSILNQSYEDLEVIVINDGSTDSSFERTSRLAACDARLHIVSQDNHGLVY